MDQKAAPAHSLRYQRKGSITAPNAMRPTEQLAGADYGVLGATLSSTNDTQEPRADHVRNELPRAAVGLPLRFCCAPHLFAHGNAPTHWPDGPHPEYIIKPQ